MSALIAERSKIAADLEDQIRDLGQTRSAITTHHSEVWRQTAGMGVTERREQVKAEVADLTAEAAVLEAEVEALQVRLGQLDQEIAWEMHNGS